MFANETLLDIIFKGGIAMIPLGLCSILILAIIIERMWSFRKINIDVEELLYKIQNSILKGNVMEAINLCEMVTGPLPLIFKEGLLRYDRSKDEIIEGLDRVRIEESLDLKRYIWMLGTIGSIAPFIGLFGTVLGIIRAFHNIGLTGTGGIDVVAGGISEALVATAGGLFVAIIAVAAYNYFIIKVNTIGEEFRIYTARLVEILTETERRKR
ncbi:MAG: MotA/TolQ/ExbB proton channel family protein [bacterium]